MMASIKPGNYRRFSRLWENETFEPMIFWGIRMAISAMAPLIWGLYTGHILQSIWITLTAEALCWIELKGSFAWRIRVLAAGAGLAIIFSVLGSITGANIWLSVLCMLAVGFIASLFKNLGDRGSGMAISIYLLFIFCNGYPVTTLPQIADRTQLIVIGALWAMAAGLLVSVIMPAERPYRRYIGVIWRAVCALIETISKGLESDVRSNVREIYLKEKDVRAALDSSFQLYGTMASQANKGNNIQYQLAQLRKAASLIAVNVIGISEEMEHINIKETNVPQRLKLAALLNALQQTASRISVYMITLKPEEITLITSRISRISKIIQLIKENNEHADYETSTITRITVLADRCMRLMQASMTHIQQMGRDIPVYRSYSLLKTLFILQPQQIKKSLSLLFNFNTFTVRYALRASIAAAFALFIYKYFNIEHGYWLPFSVMIVIQPYFGATFKKAIDRVAGTLLGGLTGSVLLRMPAAYHLKESILFVTFVLMVYYLRKNYAIAAFVITLNVVLLFNLEAALNPMLIITRALCTIGGAGLAVISGFALLPTWDKKWLPKHLAEAIYCNYCYFTDTFFSQKAMQNWTKSKRSAESKNSNLFDSYSRYMQEPGDKGNAAMYYGLIMHNVRITRELNNIHSEREGRQTSADQKASAGQQIKIAECLQQYNKVMSIITNINPAMRVNLLTANEIPNISFHLSDIQMNYLEKIILELQTLYNDLVKFNSKTFVVSPL